VGVLSENCARLYLDVVLRLVITKNRQVPRGGGAGRVLRWAGKCIWRCEAEQAVASILQVNFV